MNTTKTDRELSLAAQEFVWDTSNHTDVHKLVMPVLMKWIRTDKTEQLLDLGCGNGALTFSLSKLGIKCAGLDHSASGIQLASNNYPEIDFFQSAMDLPLPSAFNSKFDTVLSVEVIEHLMAPRQIFERAKEALKPNGYLVITTPYHGYFKNLALAITNSFDMHWHPLRDFGHIKFFSKKTLTQLFDEQGFEVIEFKRVGRIPIFAKSMIVKGRLKH